MSTATLEPPVEPKAAPLIVYEPTKAAIAQLAEQYGGLKIAGPEDAAGYKAVQAALSQLTHNRTSIEAKRKELKADSLAWGRKVDNAARELTLLIEAIEHPLRIEKKKIDDEKERAFAAAAQAERERLEAIERAKRAEEEAKLKAIRDAEEVRLAGIRREMEAERARLDEERRKANEAFAAQVAEEKAKLAEERRLEDERRTQEAAMIRNREAQLKAEQDAIAKAQREAQAKIDAERRKLDEEKAAAERKAFEEQARIKAEKEAKEWAEKVKASEERLRLAAEQEAKEAAARAEAAKPEVERIKEQGRKLDQFVEKMPVLKEPACNAFINEIASQLAEIADRMEAFTIK